MGLFIAPSFFRLNPSLPPLKIRGGEVKGSGEVVFLIWIIFSSIHLRSLCIPKIPTFHYSNIISHCVILLDICLSIWFYTIANAFNALTWRPPHPPLSPAGRGKG
jgi:hypothetical protein